MIKYFTTAAIVAFAVASPGTAQTEKTGKEARASLHAQREAIELMLLRQKSVREELKITPEGAKAIFEFTHKQHQKAMEIHMLPIAEQAAKWEAMVKENDEFLKKDLTPEQHKRLHQIAMQTAGMLFVTGRNTAMELKLTPEQEAEAMKYQHEAHEKVMEILKGDREGRNEKLTALRETTHEKLHKLLTEEQRRKWKELVGDPFKGKLEFEEQEKGK